MKYSFFDHTGKDGEARFVVDDGIYERSVQVNVFHLVELLLQRHIFKETTRFSFLESGRSINYLKTWITDPRS